MTPGDQLMTTELLWIKRFFGMGSEVDGQLATDGELIFPSGVSDFDFGF